METRAFRMSLNPGQADEYLRRHNPIWPELTQALCDAGVVDYRIFLDPQSNALFAVISHHHDHGLGALPGTELMRRWWQFMQDIMPSHSDASPISVDLQPMFSLTLD